MVVKIYLVLFGIIPFCSLPVSTSSIDNTVLPWDILIFTQNWPTTICDQWVHDNPAHSCTFPHKHDSWTSHGIWPTKLGTIGPEYCNKTWRFDPDKIKTIETNLQEYWTNVEKETSTYSFWSHEWEKHGTCAALIEPLNSELKYFSQGIEWVQHYNMYNVLDSMGIIPSDTKQYLLEDINKALYKSMGKNAMIECHKTHKQQYLSQLRICFDANLKPCNCDGALLHYTKLKANDQTILTNCDYKKGIIYPENPNKKAENYKLFIQFYKLITWLQWITL